MLREQWEEIRSTSCKKLRETDKWRLSMRDKHVHPITTNMCMYDDKYIYKIDVCLLSSTKSFEELKKIRSGRIINGWGTWGILGRSLSWFRKQDSGSNIQRVANCLKIYNNKETATFTKNELFIDVASSPHIPHLKR